MISAHTLGMFAFSPLSGRLTDRFGANAMILAGFSVLAVAGVLAAVIPDSGAGLAIPMFLLGVGWNLGFVAGSSLLASEAPLGDRARLQGASDALVWATAAAASFSSGYVVATAELRLPGRHRRRRWRSCWRVVVAPDIAGLAARRRPNASASLARRNSTVRR